MSPDNRLPSSIRPLEIRSRLFQLTRQFFWRHHFTEIDTPILYYDLPLEPNIYSFKTNWSHSKKDLYMQTSPEFGLKKFISSRPVNCFAISKCFRNLESSGQFHQPEFTMLEWYQTKSSYQNIIRFCQKYILYLAHQFNLKKSKRTINVITYQNTFYNLSTPWPVFTYHQLFKKYLNLNLDHFDQKQHRQDPGDTLQDVLDRLFLNHIEPNLPSNKPFFITNFPAIMSPLAKPSKSTGNSTLPTASRFEFYLGHIEIANGCTENRDSKLIVSQFKNELSHRRRHNHPFHPYSNRFARISQKLPPSAGAGLGLDRLAMLFSNSKDIKDVLLLPL